MKTTIPTSWNPNIMILAQNGGPIATWLTKWGGTMQVLGGAIIALCLVIVGIKVAGQSAGGGQGGQGGGGLRQALGSVFGIIIGSVIVGAALVVAPWFVQLGTTSTQ